MKKILLLTLPFLLLLTACSKHQDGPSEPIDESYWLNQDKGIVAFSDFNCDYFIVETSHGYSLLRNWGGFAPMRGAVLYGGVDRFGMRNFYNRSEGYVLQAEVRESWLSYWDAIDQMNWNCSQY